ncbi:tigger transposable element-derived protein 1 [Nephila pilipes]|uniref:Tigger transposable element-derived protein 1 n=1 Tax=Nephila pilipes TaxID=299642 RepID=A0A8X6TLQ5_NEPPI|nr:tigger transposable element-derived protein 1 [Nephila pilipes]
MDQQVISNFKKLFTKHLFKRCFEVTENANLTLREFWKNHHNIVICLKLTDIAWQGFEGFEPIEEEIVSIGRSIGLEVDEADVADLIEEYAEEFTTEELKELQKISSSEVMMELSSEEEVKPEEELTLLEISDILGKWQEVSNLVEKRQPAKLSTGSASALFDDRCLTFFRNILKRRQKQTSLDRYLVKVSRSESQESEDKKARL